MRCGVSERRWSTRVFRSAAKGETAALFPDHVYRGAGQVRVLLESEPGRDGPGEMKQSSTSILARKKAIELGRFAASSEKGR